MSNKQTTETPKKSKLTKVVEGYAALPLHDQIAAHDLVTGILEKSLTDEDAKLSQQRTNIESILETIKK